jgi:ATP/maltotriose-dependent transcriptional regulator MalT
VHVLQRAAREPGALDLAGLHLDLGRAALAGGLDGAVDHLREALAAAADPETTVAAAVALAGALFVVDDVEDAVRMLEAVRSSLPPNAAESAARLALTRGMLTLQRGGSRHEVHTEIATHLAADLPPGVRRQVAAVAAQSAPTRDERRWLAVTAWADGALIDDVADGTLLPHALAGICTQDGHLGLAATISDALVARARQRGSPLAVATATGLRAQVNYITGRLLDAEADASLTLDLAEQGGWAAGVRSAASSLAAVWLERGRPDDADELIARFEGAGEPLSWDLLTLRALIQLARRRPADALVAARAAAAETDRVGDAQGTFQHHFIAAEALAALGERAEGRRLALEKLAAIAKEEIAIAIADGTLAVAVCAEPGDAVCAWTEAVAVLEQMEFPLHLVRGLVGLGVAIRRDRRPAEAREPLQRALDIAGACHAVALADRAADELAAAGGQPRRRAATGVDALSPSERRVCQLAVDGLSNTRIAQTLFVSVKTVETQLSSAYRKLGIARRNELAGVLTTV